MIELELRHPHWIKGDGADDPEDQCAHGCVWFKVDGLVISDASENWTVSAAALFLLRTVTNEHTEANSVAEANFLIPCCGFSPFKNEGRFNLLLMGCNKGIDPEIKHVGNNVEISIEGQSRVVSRFEWAYSVVHFSNQVLDYYSNCLPKEKIADEYSAEGWELFWQEFGERLQEAIQITKSI